MKTDASFISLQRELQMLIEQNEQPDRRRKLEADLRSRFAVAWQFRPDRLRLGYRLQLLLNGVPGFDHCEYFTGANDQRVIVTQPYGDYEAELTRGLTLSVDMAPEIIVATEWAFYYPAHANLIIIKFPINYDKAWADFQDAIQYRIWKDREVVEVEDWDSMPG
jgi:hypothetical protein